MANENEDIIMKADDLKIGWGCVKEELFKKERIPPLVKNGPKHIIHIAVDHVLKIAKSLSRPGAVFTKKGIIDIRPGSIEIEGGIKFSGKRLSAYLKDACSVHLFLVTLGGGIEEEASRFMSEEEPLYGYLLDSIGSLAIESLAETVENKLRVDYRSKGKSVSMRLSPGYCDWPIEEQFVMANAIDFSKIGISLTKKCMMVPKKSISAMVGVGPKDLFSNNVSQCGVCDKTDCDHRRTSARRS